MRSPLRSLFTACTLAGVLGACEQTAGPDADERLDTRAALADYQAMDDVFSSPGWSAFQALGGRTPMSAALATGDIESLADGHSGRAYAQQLFRDLRANRSRQSLAKAIIGTQYLGRTMVYSAAADQYVFDPARTGAPANGVRFVLYETDASDKPVAAKEIGYADLLDEGVGAGEAVVLRFIGVVRGATIVDYRTRVEISTGNARIVVNGFVADGSDKLAFDITATGVETGARTRINVDYSLTLTPRSFRVTGNVNGVEEGVEGTGDVTMTIRHGDATLGVDFAARGATVEGEILINGKTFATISGPSANPTLKGAGGQPLTAQELLVVLRVVDVVDDVFDLIEDLMQPVDNLVALGWVLS